MLKAGFYEKEITPPLGYSMPGYFGVRLAKGVRDRLYVKALALEMDENTVIMLALDGIGTSDALCDPVLERIESLTGITRENVLIAATHTHTGHPRVVNSEMKTNSNDSTGEDYEAYFHILRCLMADTAVLAYQRMKPATVKYASSVEKGLTFNRNYKMKDGSIRTNPGIGNPDIVEPFGKVDEEFTMLYFMDEEGKPVGALSSFACHHDSIGGEWGNLYSSDFSGILAKNMKKEFGDDFVSVFFAGACGNLNHIDVNRGSTKYDHPRYLDIGNQLSEAAINNFKKAEELKVDRVESAKKYVDINRMEITPEDIQEAKHLIATVPKGDFVVDIGKPDSIEYKRANADTLLKKAELPLVMPVCVQAIRIGEFMLFAFLGEPYTEFGISVKEKSPAKVNMVATLANGGRSCYLATKDAIGTQIYEAQLGSRVYEASAGEKIVDFAVTLANELMEK